MAVVLVHVKRRKKLKGVREWGSGFMDLGDVSTGAGEPAKLKEEALNRTRNFHRKRFLENNCV